MKFNNLIVHTPQVNGRNVSIDIECSTGISKFFRCKQYIAEFSKNVDDVPNSVQVIPLLANLLPFSWLTNTVVQVDELDDVFYEHVPLIKKAFQEMYPQIKFGGSLIAARLRNNSRQLENPRTLMLFSGGGRCNNDLL